MKAIVRVDYREYIIDADKAIKIMELIEGEEVYEEKWHKGDDNTESWYTYHVYPEDTDSRTKSLKLINNEAYKIMKMAGKPE